MTSFAADAAALAAIYLVAATCLTLAYKRSGRVWVLRHCIVLPTPTGRTYRSGRDGELVILSLCTIAALVVTYFTPDVSLVGIIGRWPWQTAASLAFVYTVILLYSFSVLKEAAGAGRKPLYCLRLKRAYAVYNLYSACLFGVGALILLMLLAQFLHDGAVFQTEASNLTALFKRARDIVEAPRPPGLEAAHMAYAVSQSQAEAGFSGIAVANKLLQNQFNPLFIFAGTLIGINIVINYTALRGLFMGQATVMTVIFTYVPLILIAAMALFIYLSVYDSMLATAQAHLVATAPPPQLGDWEMAQRHAEMVAFAAESRNLFGFGKAVAGGGGGFAILLWGIEQALAKIGEQREKEHAAPLAGGVRMPSHKYRPNAR